MLLLGEEVLLLVCLKKPLTYTIFLNQEKHQVANMKRKLSAQWILITSYTLFIGILNSIEIYNFQYTIIFYPFIYFLFWVTPQKFD